MNATKFVRREVSAKLIEANPSALGQWVLAAPIIVFIAWAFLDLFNHFSPIPWRWLDTIISVLIFLFVVLLPLGLLAHRAVTAFPKLFANAGWDVQPLEPVAPAEMYSVRYQYKARERAPNSWSRLWLRVAQGWVYLEITAIFVGFAAIGPIYFSALEFGFGQ